MATVLMYGKDSDLLETRGLVLERAGFRSLAATSLDDIQTRKADHAPDVVLFCHTLTTEECDRALTVVQEQWPSAQRLVLTAGERGCRRPHLPAIDATEGPRKLVQTVGTLVAGLSPAC